MQGMGQSPNSMQAMGAMPGTPDVAAASAALDQAITLTQDPRLVALLQQAKAALGGGAPAPAGPPPAGPAPSMGQGMNNMMRGR